MIRLENIPGAPREVEAGDVLHIVPHRGSPYRAKVLAVSAAGDTCTVKERHKQRLSGVMRTYKRRHHVEELEEWYAAGHLRINPADPHDGSAVEVEP